ncbi:E3 ubiquitin-protein ligase MIB1-like [Polistes fuscatus]|uniref:E3 ubiquitin-protein ligase MIB1-like n=1 Tax=Polistes fuscatus TaxID=30207 RepID=UPI001CA89279|nr:E3 ubiquitin-protein ligase MIB1-like [Polistes fuscatus]
MVDLLLTKKNINPFVEDNDGKTSLDYAKEGKKAEILQALINTSTGEVNAVRYLIGKGVDVNVRNALHHTPLHLAAGRGHAEVVKILIREGNAEIDVFDARNQTPMHYAVNNKKLEIVKLLLKLGADLHKEEKLRLLDAILKEEINIDIVNNKGLSPIYLAAEKGIYM